MSRTEAHRILDAARDGSPVPAHRIEEALRVTGDLREAVYVPEPEMEAA